MIIKKQVDGIQYEANLEGELMLDGEMALQGDVVVHDPDLKGGRRRAFLIADGARLPEGHVTICKAAFK